MDKKLIDEVYINADDDQDCKLHLTYYMLTDNISEEYCDLMVYGAEIDKECFYKDGSHGHETKSMRELFFRHDEAESFIKLIARNSVTPMGLKYAVRDHISDRLKLSNCEG